MVLKLRGEAPDWSRAKCRNQPPARDGQDIWFGEDLGRPAPDLMRQAYQVCNGMDNRVVCPQRQKCLVFALKNAEAWGIWGGMREDDRKYLRNHTDEETWKWTPPLPYDVKQHGVELRARRSRAA